MIEINVARAVASFAPTGLATAAAAQRWRNLNVALGTFRESRATAALRTRTVTMLVLAGQANVHGLRERGFFD